MRILAISHNFPHKDDPSCGIFAQLQLSGVARLGADIDLLVPLAYAPEFIAKSERYKLFRKRRLLHFDGVNEQLLRYFKIPGAWFRRWEGLSGYMSALRMINKKKYDAIYAIGFFPEADIAVRLKSKFHIPVTALAIGTDINVVPKINKKMYQRYVTVANSIDYILTCGEGLAEQIRQVTPKDKPIKPVYGLVDMNVFKPVTATIQSQIRQELSLPNSGKIVLFVGHIIRTKGIFELIDAWNTIAKKFNDIYLVLIGDGQDKAELLGRVETYNLRDYVRTVGVVPHSQMHRWMNASDLLVLPSYSEGVPNVVMEAMACGLPVVATTVGGLPAAVGDSRGAILIPPKSSEQLADAMIEILDDDAQRQSMSIAARATAMERFDINQNANNVMQAIKETLGK